MEITSENFEAQFGLITDSIMNAEFIAIDTEFSGNYCNYKSKITDHLMFMDVFRQLVEH